MIYVRILEFYLPIGRELKSVIDEVSSSADDSALLQVGKMYYSQYIKACTFVPLSVHL